MKNTDQINITKKIVFKKSKTVKESNKDINFSIVDVYNLQKKVICDAKLSDQIWKLPFHEHLVRDLVVLQQASLRQGTKKTKGRGEVSGGGRKPWKQKGTGRARHGSSRSPIWVGGGVTFGPTGKENYTKKMNRRLFRKGIAIILSKLLEEKRIFFIKNEIDFKKPSSKEASILLRNFVEVKEKILVIFFHQHINWYLSLRNLQNVSFIDVKNLSPFALINADKILFPSQGILEVEERLSF